MTQIVARVFVLALVAAALHTIVDAVRILRRQGLHAHMPAGGTGRVAYVLGMLLASGTVNLFLWCVVALVVAIVLIEFQPG